MRIESFNSNGNRQNFKAKIDLSGGGFFKGPKSLLPKGSLERLEAKAKNIGTDKDTIFINIFDFNPKKPNALWTRGKDLKTKLYLYHDFPSKNSRDVNFPEPNIISGDTEKRKHSAYVAIWKYIDLLQEKFAK